MKKPSPDTAARLYTPRASLAAIGLKIRSLKLFDTIAEHVHIRQKTLKHTPLEKLTDAFMAILSGAHGLCEINPRVRPDAALQRAFGRSCCAEQSVVQETLSACTADNVPQMESEVIVARLYPGNLQLRLTMPHLVEAMEQTLELDEAQRSRTVLRIDAGGGSMNGINWLLERGYHVHCKDFSSRRAAPYALSVKEWMDDPSHGGRQLGWAIVKSGDYARPVRRLAMRWRKRNGQKCHAMLISTLEPEEVMELLGQPPEKACEAQAVLLAYARLSDERGRAIEIDIKESKQGLGIARRNKKSYCGQQMVMLLGHSLRTMSWCG